MVRHLAVTLSTALTLVAFAAAFASQSTGNRAEIDAFYGAWMGGAAQKGPAAYASFYADDGMMLPPAGRPVVGHAAIEDFQRQSQATNPYTVKPTGIAVNEVRFLDNDWVIYRSTLSGSRVSKSTGAATPFETKYFDVLHRGADARWQVAYRMWSDNLQ